MLIEQLSNGYVNVYILKFANSNPHKLDKLIFPKYSTGKC